MVTTAFLPILSALDRLFIGHIQGPLAGRLNTWASVTHVAFGTLVDYVRGLGSPADRDHVREHLATCAHCEHTAERLRELAAIAAEEIDCEVPDEVVEDAIALFTADDGDRRALADVESLFTRRSRRPAYDGEPPSAQRPPRFLRFSAPGGEIDVQLLVLEDADGVSVSGQIVARQAGQPLDWEVSAHRGSGGDAIVRTRASEGGLFQLRYDAPAAALLRFVNAAAPESVDLPIEP